MPTVPKEYAPQVAPPGPSDARFSVPVPQNFAPQQAMQMGQVVEGAGLEAGRQLIDATESANQLRRIDARNRAREVMGSLIYDPSDGLLAQKGLSALERSSKMALPDEYGERFKNAVDEIAATLGNDRQRELFKSDAADLQLQLNETARRHLSKEMTTYQVGTYDGAIKSQQRAIALMGGNGQDLIDPVTKRSRIDDATEEIRAAVFAKARQLGTPQELAEQEAIVQLSAAHHDAFAAAVQAGKLQYAEGYFNKYRSQMTPDHILAAQGLITKQMDAQVASGVATQVVRQMVPRLAPTDMDRAFNILLGSESGGQHFGRDGQPLTSPKGAIGIAQVMPGTAPEAAKLAGLPWDEARYKGDPAYNRALGEAYFKKQLQDFGDLSLAYAAYNAGPGAVRKALAASKRPVMVDAGDSNAPNPSGAAMPKRIGWLSLLPAETQAYVTENMAAFTVGGGVPPRPTEVDIDTQLQSNPALAGNPARLKLAREEAFRQFKMQEDAIKQREDTIVAEAQRIIIASGGDMTAVPATVRAQIPPGKMDDLLGFAGRIAKGDDVTSPLLYAKFSAHPEELVKMTDAAWAGYRRALSEADFKHFSNERAKQLGGAQGANGPGDLNSGAIKQTLEARMRVLGIDPTPKDDGGKDAARVGAIRQFVDQYFIAAQRDAGKKFSDAEVTQHIDALFAKNATFRGWFSDSSGPMLGMRAENIATATRDQLRATLKRSGNDNPTDAQILDAYWHLKVAQPGR